MRSGKRRVSQADEPRWIVNGEIPPSGIWQVKSELETGNAHPADVRATLRSIARVLDYNLHPSPEMLQFLRVALNRFMAGRSLDQAFGLKRTKNGRPPLSLAMRQRIAAAVLRERLSGRSLEAAAIAAGHQFGIGSSEARRHWAESKALGLSLLWHERRENGGRWTPRERAKLETLFSSCSEAEPFLR